MKILFAVSECTPFASSGGLGDVAGSLPEALNRAGAEVRVIMPLYSSIDPIYRNEMKKECEFNLSLSWRRQYCAVYSLKKENTVYYFVDNAYYFHRRALYGEYDDGERFAFFSMAVVSAIGRLGFSPDILHAHDWQTALSVIYLKRLFSLPVKTVFTIHNIEYQGKFDHAILGDVFALRESERSLVDFGGCINLLKGAIVTADTVSTVSPTYKEEIKNGSGMGLDGILRENDYKLCGILNGIDTSLYNPECDGGIAERFSPSDLSGKGKCKLSLQRELGLHEGEHIPLVSLVSRLVHHKGIDIVIGSIYPLLYETDIEFVLLGQGEWRYEEFFRSLEESFKGRVRAIIGYDRPLSRRIYSASDLFLMPSFSEPCGLAQMIASRYGAIPVVRETGGLYDSIKPYYKEGATLHGNGFTFRGKTSAELTERVKAALNMEDREEFIKKIMETDFSWDKAAGEYLTLYRRGEKNG